MRNIIFVFAVVIPILSHAQKDDDYKRLIDSSIIFYENAYNKGYNEDKNKKNDTENWKIYLKEIYYKMNHIFLIDDIYNSYTINNDSLKITFLHYRLDSKKGKKLLKKGAYAWKIVSKLQGNKLRIVIIDFSVKYKNNNYAFKNGGGMEAEYQYSCEEKKWVLTKREISGI